MIDWVHNSSQHAAIKTSLAQLLFSFSPKLFPTAVPSMTNPTAESRCKWLLTAQTEAAEALLQTQTLMESRVHFHCPVFQKGDKVWLDSRHLKFPTPRKFTPRCHGPFKIK